MERKFHSATDVLQQFAPFFVLGKCKKKEISFELLAVHWLENVKLRIKESSYVKYYNLVQNHILPELGKYPATSLTTDLVEQFVQQKLHTGRRDGKGGLSEKTVKDILTVLKEICIYAAHWDIEIPCHFELIKIRSADPRIQVLSREEQLKLEQFLLNDDSLIKLGVLLSLFMGIRLGEVCALKRRDILYNEKILCVRATMQRIQDLSRESQKKTKIVITEPKSSSSNRDIPIPPFLFKRLEILKDIPEEAYILTGSTSYFIEPRTLENILKKYLRECHIEEVNYHVLRHTFATRCMENGFDAKSLSEILGHANVNITLNRYVHSSMEQKRRNMDKLERVG